MKLSYCMEAYIKNLIQSNYSERSIDTYKRDLKRIQNFFGAQSISEIDHSALYDFQSHLYKVKTKKNQSLAPATQGRILTVLRMLFRFAMKMDYIDSNPADKIELPREERRLPRHVLSEEDCKALLIACDKDSAMKLRNRAIIEVFYATGIRVSELINLKLFDIRFQEMTLHIMGKGRKERVIPISGRALLFIEQYIEELRPKLVKRSKTKELSQNLFLSINGNPFQRADVSNLVKSIGKEAKIEIKVTPHVIRHSIATQLLKNGMDIRYIQELLGHEDLRTTQIYTQVANKDLKEMLEKHHPLE